MKMLLKSSGARGSTGTPAPPPRLPAASEMPFDGQPGGARLAEAFTAPPAQIGTDPAELPSFRPLSHAAVSRNRAEQRSRAPCPAIDSSRDPGPLRAEKRIERIQSGVSALANAAVPNDRQAPSSRMRGTVLAGVFLFGVSGAIGGFYLMEVLEIADPGYMPRDQAPSARGDLVTAGPNPILDGDLVTAAQRGATSGESKSSDDAAADASGRGSLPRLVEQVRRQIAVGHLEAPADDNALETYRRMVAASPQHPGTVLAGERLSTVFWSRAMDAKRAQHWDDALHYLNILDTLPPLPASAISAEAAIVPRGLAQGGSGAPLGLLDPTKSEAPGSPNELANQALQSVEAQHGFSKNGVGATDNSFQLGLLAKERGDAAIRLGDVVAARRFYQLAASGGIAGAAGAIALTYDPLYLKGLGVRGFQGDPDLAKHWYEKAIVEGDTRARILLSQLQRALEHARR